MQLTKYLTYGWAPFLVTLLREMLVVFLNHFSSFQRCILHCQGYFFITYLTTTFHYKYEDSSICSFFLFFLFSKMEMQL